MNLSLSWLYGPRLFTMNQLAILYEERFARPSV